MKKFTSTKLFKVILILAIFGLLIFLNPAFISKPLRSGLGAFLFPFQKVFHLVSINFQNARESVAYIGQIRKENNQLLKEKQDLLAENARLRDIENENEMLRQQLGMLPRDQYNLLPAFVVSQDPNGTGNWIEIDKGSADGIEQGMSVIVSKGILIGRVQEVGIKSSQIILLTNPKSTVNAMTLENNSKGVVKGEYGLGTIFDMVLQTDSMQNGDNVITSGIGGEVPRGLYIGKVQEIHPSEDHLFQQASVTMPVQISKLEIVFVVTGVRS